jgi:hypothetical protein
MSVKSKFLTLSMRQQIPLTIILLKVFSVVIILCIVGPLISDILKGDYKLKKIYFYRKYKQYIESCFFYQNFCLLKYEEIIKRIQKQILEFNAASSAYGLIYQLNQRDYEEVKKYVIKYNSTTLSNEINETVYYHCYNFRIIDSSEMDKTLTSVFNYLSLEGLSYCDKIGIGLILLYPGFSSIIATHNIGKSFGLTEFDVPIISTPYFIHINNSMMFSFNSSIIYENIINVFGDVKKFNNVEFDKYYCDIAQHFIDTIMEFFAKYFQNELFLFPILFEENVKDIKSSKYYSSINKNDINTVYEFAKKECGFYSSISYGNNKFALLSNDANGYFYCETKIIEDYLYFVHNKLSQYLNASFIPLYAENDTIISPELCLSFLLKQMDYQVDENQINELLRNMVKGKSTIEQCFINNITFSQQLEIKDILILENFTGFLDVATIINQGVINIDKLQFYFMKYTYPNIASLIDFKSDYILLDQVNFYLFVNFKEPMEYVQSVYLIYHKCFLLIVIIIIYTWVILLIINLVIYFKIINKLTEPIKKIQDAIESSSIKDENIFIYEYDDIIQELFMTAKELLSGQVDKNNNEKGLNQFNILSIPKDKQKNIDKNIYQKNLIINNDIMNQLIKEQQNMLDYSKNIEINEELDSFRLTYNSRNNQIDDNDSSFFSESKKDSESDNIYRNKKNKIREEIEDREPYKKLFKIVEYLAYYQNKNENNIFNVINNEIRDESNTSNISKVNNSNNTLNIESKLKRSIIKGDIRNDDKDYVSINMLNNKNISYLWYMIEKKKKNKTINYYIGMNYEELFMDENNQNK